MPSPPFLLLAKVANECFKCAKKSYSRLLKTHAPVIYIISRLDGIPSYACPLNTIPVEEGFIPSVVVLLSRDSVVFLLTPLDTIPVKEGFI